MRRSVGWGLGWLVVVALASPAAAAVADMRAITLLSGRQEPVDGTARTVVPLYEMLSLSLSDPFTWEGWVEDVRLSLSGWGRVDIAGFDRHAAFDGDLQLAYVEARVARRLRVRVGRQLLTAGATRLLPMDGIHLEAEIALGIGAAAYVGVPVKRRFVAQRGELVTGGRVFWRYDFDTEVGASFLYMLNKGRVARQDLGIDGRWAPWRDLIFSASAVLNTVEMRLAEADLHATWRPFKQLEVAADYRHLAPDLFLPARSLYSVFSEESRNEVGALASWRPWSEFSATVDYHFLFDEAFTGHRATARLELFLGAGRADVVGTEIGILFDNDGFAGGGFAEDGYLHARLFGRHRLLEGLRLAGDVAATLLGRTRNGEAQALLASASLDYAWADNWQAVLTTLVGTSPFATYRFEIMAKLVFNGEVFAREVTP